MKKIGIISDTHNLLRPEVEEILKGCDCIIHAGDIGNAEILDQIRWYGDIYAVQGNNDFWSEKLAKTLHFQIEEVKFALAHMKRDIAMHVKDAQVIICGHTHKYSEKVIDQRLWLNPGSCGPRRFDQEITMAVMYVDKNRYRVEKLVISGERKGL